MSEIVIALDLSDARSVRDELHSRVEVLDRLAVAGTYVDPSHSTRLKRLVAILNNRIERAERGENAGS
jgi:hypothetical protein